MVAQHLLHGPALEAHPRLPHDLGALADPDHQHELDPPALRVVGVLDPHVRVLRLRPVQLRRQLADAPRARLRELQRVTHRRCV